MYPPSEDSYLLAEQIKKYLKNLKNKNIKVLDLGSGSGIQVSTLIKSGISPKNITLVDIDEKVILYLSRKFPNSKSIKSDLFKNIQEKFDLIIFNPPYLPENKYDKNKDTSGGKIGNETINKFLKQA